MSDHDKLPAKSLNLHLSSNAANLHASMPSLEDYDLESVCDNPKSVVEERSYFTGKTLVVTGAGGQFGREGCLYFAKRGCRIAALDQNRAGLKETFDAVKQELGEEEFDFKMYVCDVTRASQIAAVVKSICERFQRIDMLWNNAGYQGKINTTIEYDPEDFSRVMNINVTGMFIVMQACAKQMMKQGESPNGGSYSIVNTASVAGLRGTPAMIAYSSSKAAVLAMTVTAAKDLAPIGVRVNSISPALIGAGMMWERQNKLHAESGSPFFDSDPDVVAEKKIASVPMKRLGTTQEVIKSVAFLLSDASSYTTGSNLVVDGGLSAGLKA